MSSYTTGKLYALIALAGGDVSRAAEDLGVDEDVLQSAVDGQRLPLKLQRDLERKIEDFEDEQNRKQRELINGLTSLLDYEYPQLTEIFWNDGVAEALGAHPEFLDIFRKDPTKYYNEAKGKWYSGGGLYPGAVDVIVDWAKNTKKGTPRKRGQADLSPMVDALEEDNYEIGDIDESAFWSWFRSIYPEN